MWPGSFFCACPRSRLHQVPPGSRYPDSRAATTAKARLAGLHCPCLLIGAHQVGLVCFPHLFLVLLLLLAFLLKQGVFLFLNFYLSPKLFRSPLLFRQGFVCLKKGAQLGVNLKKQVLIECRKGIYYHIWENKKCQLQGDQKQLLQTR